MKEEDFDISFLDPEKLKKSEDKIKNGEITCNIENPAASSATKIDLTIAREFDGTVYKVVKSVFVKLVF